jgi:hypothetical protein
MPTLLSSARERQVEAMLGGENRQAAKHIFGTFDLVVMVQNDSQQVYVDVCYEREVVSAVFSDCIWLVIFVLFVQRNVSLLEMGLYPFELLPH